MPDIKSRENYTRITTILAPFSGLDKVPMHILAHAAARGTKVHEICEGISRGLGEIGTDDETQGYVESFKKWWGLGHEIVDIERRFWDDDLKLTGQVDFIIKTEDGLAIVDLKTSSRFSPTWPVQGAAYAYLANLSGYDIKRIHFLHLHKLGKNPHIFEYAPNESLLFSVLQTWEHFFRPQD